ncbi:MAG: thioesterase family protein, partial [Gammaproteobacteria bacterium]|nr:thioesterase family protein [Gammaproteobacteria bacterium]
LAFEIERQHGEPDLQPARLTVDLYRMPDFSAVEVTTTRVRDGRRIRVVDAEFVSGGVGVGRASCQLLRRSETPSADVWTRDNWDVAPPDDIEPPSDPGEGLGGMWATRAINGKMGTAGPRRVWISEVRELVGGCDLTPWQRVALAADFTSPFANSGVEGLGFINTDITLYLQRLPRTQWIGFEVVNHQSTEGVANGECYLYDETGPIGSSTVAALAQRR